MAIGNDTPNDTRGTVADLWHSAIDYVNSLHNAVLVGSILFVIILSYLGKWFGSLLISRRGDEYSPFAAATDLMLAVIPVAM